jgi:hypothetical protein
MQASANVSAAEGHVGDKHMHTANKSASMHLYMHCTTHHLLWQ